MPANLVAAALNIDLSWTYRNARDLTNTDDVRALLSANAISLAFLNGPGDNQANQLFHDRRTLGNGVSEEIDLYDYEIDGTGGAQNDSLGLPLTIVDIKGFLFYNRSAVSGEVFKIFGEGSAAAWDVPFDGVATTKMVVQPSGFVCLGAPLAAGLAVTDATNHLLKVENTGAAENSYDLIIIGAST